MTQRNTAAKPGGFDPDKYLAEHKAFDPSTAVLLDESSSPDPSTFPDQYVWKREVPIYRHKNPGELFDDLAHFGDWRLWFYVLSPYLGVCLVRSVIWSARTAVTR